jgi:hypothetical protein
VRGLRDPVDRRGRITPGQEQIVRGDAQVLASLTASVVLLVSFVFIEMRSSRPLLPMRVLADRNRSGSYLIIGRLRRALGRDVLVL